MAGQAEVPGYVHEADRRAERRPARGQPSEPGPLPEGGTNPRLERHMRMVGDLQRPAKLHHPGGNRPDVLARPETQPHSISSGMVEEEQPRSLLPYPCLPPP